MRLLADLRKAWQTWCYPLDELTDNDNFPRRPYDRQSRHIITDYVITQFSGHAPGGPDVEDGVVKNEAFILREPGLHWRPFPISYRAICPKSSDATTLITPTCPSTSVVGYSYVRIEHTFWQLGQACANAAHLSIGRFQFRDDHDADLKKLMDEQKIVTLSKNAGAPHFDNTKALPPVSLGM